MKRKAILGLLLVAAVIVLAACGGGSEEPTATPAAAAEAAAPAEATEEAAPAAEAAAPAAEEAAPAAAAGPSEQVVNAITRGGCTACHVIPDVPNAVGQVGPDLSNIGVDAATRVPGQSAVDYIHESIVDPNKFTSPKCPFGDCVAGTMPANIKDLISDEEINAVVEYLVTLKSGS